LIYSSLPAELKRLADEDARYLNVSLGFDTATLQPTYELLWGAAGSSNALEIARTLGFDGCVVGARSYCALRACMPGPELT